VISVKLRTKPPFSPLALKNSLSTVCKLHSLSGRSSLSAPVYLELLFLPPGNPRNCSRASNSAIASNPPPSSNIEERRRRFKSTFCFEAVRTLFRLRPTQCMTPIITSRNVNPAPTPIPVYAAMDNSGGAGELVAVVLVVGCGEGIIVVVGGVATAGPVVLPGIRMLP
jgi:hypothetical protein